MYKILIGIAAMLSVASCAAVAPPVSNFAAFRIESACNVTKTRYYRLPNGGLEVTYHVTDGHFTQAKQCLEKEVPAVLGDPFPVNNGKQVPNTDQTTVVFGD